MRERRGRGGGEAGMRGGEGDVFTFSSKPP